MKVYISGKITGYPIKLAHGKFIQTADFLKSKGFEPVNPFDLSPTDEKKTWEEYMIDDIRGLFECKAIYLHRDWGTSKGARIEYGIAKELGLKIFFEGDLDQEPFICQECGDNKVENEGDICFQCQNPIDCEGAW